MHILHNFNMKFKKLTRVSQCIVALFDSAQEMNWIKVIYKLDFEKKPIHSVSALIIKKNYEYASNKIRNRSINYNLLYCVKALHGAFSWIHSEKILFFSYKSYKYFPVPCLILNQLMKILVITHDVETYTY